MVVVLGGGDGDRVCNIERAAVSTLAGGVKSGANDASGTDASFALPTGVAVDASGSFFVADRFNQRIRKMTAGGGMLFPRSVFLAFRVWFRLCVCLCEFLYVRALRCIRMLERVMCVCAPCFVCGCGCGCVPVFVLILWFGSVFVSTSSDGFCVCGVVMFVTTFCLYCTRISRHVAFISRWYFFRLVDVMVLLPLDCVCTEL